MNAVAVAPVPRDIKSFRLAKPERPLHEIDVALRVVDRFQLDPGVDFNECATGMRE